MCRISELTSSHVTASSQSSCREAIQQLPGCDMHHTITSWQRVLHSGNCGFHSQQNMLSSSRDMAFEYTSTKCTAQPRVILISRDGILMPIGSLPESLSQAISIRIISAGRLDVFLHGLGHDRPRATCATAPSALRHSVQE